MSIFIPKYKIQALVPVSLRATTLALLRQNGFSSNSTDLKKAVGTINVALQQATVEYFFAAPTVSEAQYDKLVALEQVVSGSSLIVLSAIEEGVGWPSSDPIRLPSGMVFLDQASYPNEWHSWLKQIVDGAL